MAKAAYIGVDGVARKVKKGYVGVDGVARKIKKAYIGIGSVARPCWPAGELEYYGAITGLSTGRCYLAATSIGDYALFGGGSTNQTSGLSIVDAYDKSLTLSTPTALSASLLRLAATSVGDYALFGGGESSRSSSESGVTTVNAYDKSLTRTIPTALSAGRYFLAATSVGDYALFGGGISKYISSTTTYSSVVNAYDKSLTRSTPTALSAAAGSLAATTVGDYALFGGGTSTRSTSKLYGVTTVNAYDTSLTRTTPAELSAGRFGLAATAVGDYALFGGGNYTGTAIEAGTGTVHSTVDAYDKSLTLSAPTELSVARTNLTATSVGDYALFGCGIANSSDVDARVVVDAYDSSLVRTIPTQLSDGGYFAAATSIGDYALFGGGISRLTVVEAYVA